MKRELDLKYTALGFSHALGHGRRSERLARLINRSWHRHDGSFDKLIESVRRNPDIRVNEYHPSIEEIEAMEAFEKKRSRERSEEFQRLMPL